MPTSLRGHALGLALTTTCGAMAQDWRLLDGAIPTSSSGAFDSERQRVVSVGGAGETREWDGSRWLYRPVGPVPGRVVHQVFDSRRGVTVVLSSDIPFTAPTPTWEFDGITWTLRNTPVAPPQLVSGGVAYDAWRGRTVLWGGGFLPGNATWEWDGALWQQRFPASLPPARSAPAMAFDDARGRTVLFGGHVISGLSTIPFGDTWEWDGSTWQRQFPAISPSPRGGCRLAFDSARHRMVMFGSNGTLAAETWEYDGTIWIARPGPQPPARAFPGLVYDRHNARTVLWTGISTTALGDTWEWDGTAWLQRLQETSPTSRVLPATAYAATRDRLVMFGGLATNSAETWEWDGAAWALQSPAASPPGRYQHAMWSDGNDVFVFGGGLSQSPYGNDTWRYDGTTWTLMPSTLLPPVRHSAAVAFDPTNGGALLFGGAKPGVVLSYHGDTWRWTAAGWTPATPTTAPSPRSNAAIAGDPVRQRVVLWGGHGNNGALTDTWEWDGTDWLLQSPVHNPPSGPQRAMVYEPDLGGIVLLTGSNGTPLQTWVWTGADWFQVSTTVPFTPAASVAASAAPGRIRVQDGERLHELSLQPATVSSYGASCPAPGPRLLVDTWPRLGAADFGLSSVGHPASAPSLLLLGTAPANIAVAGCTSWVQFGGPTVLRTSDAAGLWHLPLPLPQVPALVSLRVYAQAWSLGASGPLATNAIDVTLGR